MDNYEKLDLIGEGAFGGVYKARNKHTNQIVAMKCLKQKYRSWDECLHLKEIKALSKLKHPNIIRLKEVFKKDDILHMIFEYAESNLLEHYNQKYRAKGLTIPDNEIKNIIGQIAKALVFMHRNGYFHRDLKPENILITTDGIVKLADFGLAREIRSAPPFTDYVATRWYRAPEILLKSRHYSSPVDIFALGCIMAELYLLKPLFMGGSEIDQLFKICEGLGYRDGEWTDGERWANLIGVKLPSNSTQSLDELLGLIPPDAMSLIKSMLEINSVRRISALQTLNHSYLFGISSPPTDKYKSKQLLRMPDVENKMQPLKKDLNSDKDALKLATITSIQSPELLPAIKSPKANVPKMSRYFSKDMGTSKFDKELMDIRRHLDFKYGDFKPSSPLIKRSNNHKLPTPKSKYMQLKSRCLIPASKTEYKIDPPILDKNLNSPFSHMPYRYTSQYMEHKKGLTTRPKAPEFIDDKIDDFLNDSLFKTKVHDDMLSGLRVDSLYKQSRYKTEDAEKPVVRMHSDNQPSYLRGLNIINKH